MKIRKIPKIPKKEAQRLRVAWQLAYSANSQIIGWFWEWLQMCHVPQLGAAPRYPQLSAYPLALVPRGKVFLRSPLPPGPDAEIPGPFGVAIVDSADHSIEIDDRPEYVIGEDYYAL